MTEGRRSRTSSIQAMLTMNLQKVPDAGTIIAPPWRRARRAA